MPTNSTPVPPPPPSRRRFGMPLRDLVILIVSASSGAAAGLLLASTAMPMGQAIVSGFAAFAATLYFLDRIAE